MLRTGQAKSVRAVSQVSYESGVRVAGPFFFFFTDYCSLIHEIISVLPMRESLIVYTSV